MRIIAGAFRNRPLITPKGTHTRPTASRTRGCVFNILQNSIEHSRFLDICAGSGAMGIEALSRGALHVTFIENEVRAQEAIRKNIAQFDVRTSTTLLTQSAPRALQALAKEGTTFDIVYFDPPYSDKDKGGAFTATIMHLIDTLPLIVHGGVFFVEERLLQEPLVLTTFTLKSTRTFGQTVLREYIHN